MISGEIQQIGEYLGGFVPQIPGLARKRSNEYGQDAIIGDISRLLCLKSLQRIVMKDCSSLRVPDPLIIKASETDRRRVSDLIGREVQPLFYQDEDFQIGKLSVQDVSRRILESGSAWIFKPDWGDKSQGIFLIRSEENKLTITIDEAVKDPKSFPLYNHLLENLNEVRRINSKLIEFVVEGDLQDELSKILDLGAVKQEGPFDPGLVEPLFENVWEYEDRPFETRHIVTSSGNVEHILAKVGRPNILDGKSEKGYKRLHPDKMYSQMAQDLGVLEGDIVGCVESAIKNAYDHFMRGIERYGFHQDQINELSGQAFNLQFDIKYIPKERGQLPELALVEIHVMIGDDRVKYEFKE